MFSLRNASFFNTVEVNHQKPCRIVRCTDMNKNTLNKCWNTLKTHKKKKLNEIHYEKL